MASLRRGRPMQVSKGMGQISCLVSEVLKRRLVDDALHTGCSLSHVIEQRIIQSYLIDDLVAARLADPMLVQQVLWPRRSEEVP